MVHYDSSRRRRSVESADRYHRRESSRRNMLRPLVSPSALITGHFRCASSRPMRPKRLISLGKVELVVRVSFRSRTCAPNGRNIRFPTPVVWQTADLDAVDDSRKHGKNGIIDVAEGKRGDEDDRLTVIVHGCADYRFFTHCRSMRCSLAYSVLQEAEGENTSAVAANCVSSCSRGFAPTTFIRDGNRLVV